MSVNKVEDMNNVANNSSIDVDTDESNIDDETYIMSVNKVEDMNNVANNSSIDVDTDESNIDDVNAKESNIDEDNDDDDNDDEDNDDDADEEDSSVPTIPNKVALLRRILLSIMVYGAIACSILAMLSCEFFSYEALDGEPWEGLSPPFEDLPKASVGLFAYSTTIGNSNGALGSSCRTYDSWEDVSQDTYFYAAQWCSLMAPIAALLGLIQIVLEWCLCRVRGSYFVIRVLFVFASLLQLGSFLVFFEPQYWCVV